MSQTKVQVDLGDRSYDIVIGGDVLSSVAERLQTVLKPGTKRVFILTDRNVWRNHGEALTTYLADADLKAITHILPPGEATKSFENLQDVLETLIRHEAERSDVLLAFGGGVIGDLAGLAAGLMKRGMPFVQIPTTLLAQVDSSVGGKTAINSSHGKNLIGLFNQPAMVLADISLLSTLPPREWRAGYAEIIKYGLIDRPDFFNHLETATADILDGNVDALSYAVKVSCESKADVVAADETERGRRALLNLGHTFGHAIEKARGFDGRVLHGEGVAAGMCMAYRYSKHLGLCSGQDVVRVERLIEASGLAPTLSALKTGDFKAEELLHHMFQDKKVESGSLTLILAEGIGKSFVQKGADVAPLREFLEVETKL
ncbi:3-dehydroquinate synthase [Ponticaulis sp.]|uniref:3-dehydroquinate synthase n=1 Tax=Ponticaulis sp. TaxID=2020902 RepID=UPI000B72370D|nr:3-dehydroquinate synthase [Ponticaulis sp.]MAI90961.1 3-dehydroquinate synthase [Ponticaulis sp.]OUX98302.1 MAG: 3-dehydroquinate synthase [Hyphomonadaceae bacterium TMED5]|tara:strand:- start:625 stop:1743 length:1119 start_codon:yes stop_codon:yes gene_type:complete